MSVSYMKLCPQTCTPSGNIYVCEQHKTLSTDGAVAQGVLTPNATVLANQHLVRPASVEGGHANQLGLQMRLTRVATQPGHPLDHGAAQRATCKFSF
jgi:hypothetical protein